ncbi:restriction endonuclease S subunit [Thiocystis violascens DSM 198]|uniref:Restriction endonuclease S subunit n=1 Tax=Thiocystis violascens (strain ATCC 17096 / DSM 198 / 6111) TaxID=765911 RepID=I3YCS1_THIV6|nr:restriction endonuclease S subunit [Thiocystis violascens DSM 198]
MPLISVGEIGTGCFKVTEHTPLVPGAVVRRIPQYVLRTGDVVFGRKGAVERSALVTENESGWFLGSDGISIRPHSDCHPPYLASQLQSHQVQSWLLQNATGTTMASLNQEILGRVQIPIAPIPEQRAIAAALSDVDALLAKLDQLIAKKRDLKQAAMQQLLTGQTRLPGFSGEWEVKRLGDLFKFSGGHSASRDQLSTEGYYYLHYGDIHGSSKTTIDTSADHQYIPKLAIALKRISPDSLLADGDVVFVDASEDDEGTSRHVVVVNKDGLPFIAGLHTIVAKGRTAELAHDYRRYCFKTAAIRQQFMFYAVGTKVSGISKTNIAKLTLPVPSVPEQTAIASILSDMDAELSALVARRDKTRALKQGMMRELLTGRIRLR